ncbi:Crp/Fnr family transcriptional regulator [Sphingomonas sp. DT-207]|uniref:Crp/Fnr family transcriptional regulator n=1 Tax=Sphingomonas sp. DT-207 TaxID=3396167 RepID=UPI003F53E6C8
MNPSLLLAPLVQRWERRAALTDEDRRAILALPHTRRTFNRDAYLVREGEPTANCHLLLSGFAYRQKLVSNGARQIISIHIPGEFVDLQNALLPIADHNVQSLGRTEVVMVPKTALVQLIAARPQVAEAVWLDTLIDASIFREWVVNVGRRDARARIAHLLCELIVRLRASGVCTEPACDFPFTQEQLADATGLTSVHTNRTLQALRREGLVNLSAAKLTVLDWGRLAEVGDFSERYLHHEA